MTIHILRKTLISVSLKHEPSNLINYFHFFFPYSFSTLVTKTIRRSNITEYLMSRHEFSPETATKAATVLIHLKDYKRSDFVIDYLKEIGLSKTQLEEMVIREPCVLATNLDKCIKPKIQKVKELGFLQDDLPNVLSAVPGIFTIKRSAERIGLSIDVLRSVLGSNFCVVKLLKVCNWFLSSDLDKTMMPNIELMKSCGITQTQIRQILFSFPRFFLHKTEFLKDCVRRVDEMGLSKDSKMYIHGIRAVSSMSMEKWESKLELFRSLGFTEDDVLSVFRRTPQVFAISERKIREVTMLLLSSKTVDISFVVQHPELLIYSAKNRIMPRLQIIDILRSKSLLPKEPSMTTLCKMTDEGFIRKFVLPYAPLVGEVGDK